MDTSEPLRPPPPDGSEPGPGAGDRLVADLSRFLADQRVDAEAASRARERWLRQQAGEEARFAGVLLDLAERATPVLVVGTAERRWRGRVTAVGEDFYALRVDDGSDVLLALAGVGAVRAVSTPAMTGGERGGVVDLTIREALLALVAARPRVVVVAAGLATAGELRGVGADVVTLRADGEGTVVYVPVAALQSVALPRPGA